MPRREAQQKDRYRLQMQERIDSPKIVTVFGSILHIQALKHDGLILKRSPIYFSLHVISVLE